MVSKGTERWFDVFTYALLILIAIVSVFPLMYVLSVSLTPYSEVLKNGGFVVIPKSITLEAYKYLFSMDSIHRSFGVTLFVTVIGTILNLVITVLLAYPLSKKKLRGRGLFIFLIVFTMMFNGGLIPTYLVVKDAGLLNTIWAMIIPSIVATFNVLIIKTFFEGLPEEIYESARMDGAGEVTVLTRIALPMSVPALMTVGLFYMVSNWNVLFPAVFYITDMKLYPLQLVVRDIIMAADAADLQVEVTLPTDTIRMAAVIVASAPIIAVYPFLQKYLIKGMVLGALKG
ncbi:carbohydrate ABC transporter permease [Paenibacillus sp. NRS-1760]|uniref:carbohydrate ABC transporter permease n=1 Tax=Paenibacillus sp. NRS-1760 TaxID=3233902 RepID=UPI003D2AB79B